jgi:hypothetical protein
MLIFSRDPDLQNLERFRQNFLFLIADGAYPPHRQQRLFLWCQKAELDWNRARSYVYQDALAFFKRVIERVVADGKITPTEIHGLRSLQRRLGLGPAPLGLVERLSDLVERKIEETLIERAAYLSAPPLIDILKREIAAYDLPTERTDRLYRVLDRQHELAKLMAGMLPVVRPGVELYHDEVCHLDIVATYTPEDAPVDAAIHGRLVATNERLMLLSPAGGMLIRWPQIQAILPQPDSVTILTTARGPLRPEQRGHVQMLGSGTVFCDDPQYVATLLGAARRVYTTLPPEPLRPNKRLPPL